jgi:hypothetical protein
MILLIVSDVILILCTILFYKFVLKNRSDNVQVMIKDGIDGSTTIYITNPINWKIIMFYLLFLITSNITIMNVIKIIEYKNIVSISLKYRIIIIIVFDIVTSIFLFPMLINTIIVKIIGYFKNIK